ncbi:MAG: hypothetical protein QF687_08105, partial [Nitrospinaceae bacterium]|nr:hypothetical protein [Nitrospinaceae bacterium]
MSDTAVGANYAEPLSIGRWAWTGDFRYFDGYIDEVRYSNTAVYTANFTPSLAPFSETGSGGTGTSSYQSDSFTAQRELLGCHIVLFE